jgi:hypothetical protein
MLRVGIGKPRVSEYDDRLGTPTKRYYVSDFFWLCPCEWRKLETYQTLAPEAEREYLRMFLRSCSGGVDEAVKDPYIQSLVAARMGVKPGRPSTIWEFEALARSKRDWVRHVAVFEEPRLVRWSWWDANVAYPALKVAAWWKSATWLGRLAASLMLVVLLYLGSIPWLWQR